jgi:acetyl esterase/lipase
LLPLFASFMILKGIFSRRAGMFRSLALLLVASIIAVGSQLAAAEPLVVQLWPGAVPGEQGGVGEETITGNRGSRQVTNVSRPALSVFQTAKEQNTGAAVIIAPGGGYRFLSWDHEGEDVATWLNKIGVTAIVLKYRVPQRSEHPKYPLQDAQRAISLVRSKAKEWDLDEKKIGLLGFSAGGHLTGVAATSFDKRAYEPIDEADKSTCRPDFAVMIYAGGILQRGSGELISDIRVTKDTPPTFLAHCSDDRGSAEQSAQMYIALKRAGVPAELHIYATGGHGFGMRQSKNPVSQWPTRCEEWMRSQGILAAAKSINP